MWEKIKNHAEKVKTEGGEEVGSLPEEDFSWPKAARTRFATTLALVSF